MVPITPASILYSRLHELREVIILSLSEAGLESQGLALRLVSADDLQATEDKLQRDDFCDAVSALAYGGIPAVAAMGFALGGALWEIPDESVRAFLMAVARVRGRSAEGHVAEDDVAILGIADGLARVGTAGAEAAQLATWLTSLVDNTPSGPLWSARMRAPAADLLDGRGRLRKTPDAQDIDPLALEVCLRRTWPSAFLLVPSPDRNRRLALMADLLTRDAPMPGELDRAAVWTAALRALIEETAAALVPGIDEVVRILRATQGGLKRWVWEQRRGRGGTMPARWLIDTEPHVQAFLWAILYPLFGAELRDEQYLPGYGQLQPRYDFGIVNLKVIVEVKFIRARADFKKVEEEVAGDIGIYFSDLERFDRMIAYVYDDCDVHHPELYDGLRNALMLRDSRIVDVVIVRRPSMMPSRHQRSGASAEPSQFDKNDRLPG